jgi:hypothetical protein
VKEGTEVKAGQVIGKIDDRQPQMKQEAASRLWSPMDDRPPLSLIGIRYQQLSPAMTLFAVRYWLPVSITAILVCVPWIDRATRFSLRTLLIATTLVAVGLGLIVYAAR